MAHYCCPYRVFVGLFERRVDSMDEIKTCPQCHRTYSDPSLSFCVDDGNVLSAPQLASTDNSRHELASEITQTARAEETDQQDANRIKFDLEDEQVTVARSAPNFWQSDARYSRSHWIGAAIAFVLVNAIWVGIYVLPYQSKENSANLATSQSNNDKEQHGNEDLVSKVRPLTLSSTATPDLEKYGNENIVPKVTPRAPPQNVALTY